MVEQSTSIDDWATASLATARPVQTPEVYAWSESGSEEGLLGVDAGCTFEGAVSPGFTTEDEEEEMARQAARRRGPAISSICMDADWLYDLGRTVHVPDDAEADADAGLQQGPGGGQPISWEGVEGAPRELQRAAPFKNVLPPIQHVGHGEF